MKRWKEERRAVFFRYRQEGYATGTVYTKEEIDKALALGETEGRRFVPSRDFSGHGTAVLGIAAGKEYKMKKHIMNEKTEISYTLYEDYYLLDLELKEQEEASLWKVWKCWYDR